MLSNSAATCRMEWKPNGSQHLRQMFFLLQTISHFLQRAPKFFLTLGGGAEYSVVSSFPWICVVTLQTAASQRSSWTSTDRWLEQGRGSHECSAILVLCHHIIEDFFWMISSNMLIDFIHVQSISFGCHASSQPASWSHLFIKSSRWIRGTKNQGDDAGRDCAAFRAEECHRCSPKCNSVTSTWANNCPYILDKRPGNERSEITLPLPLMSRKGEKNKVLLSCGSGFE